MLYFDRIDVSESINVNKISASKEISLLVALRFNQMSAIDAIIY